MPELYCLVTFFCMCFVLIACVYLGRTAVFVFTVGCILVSNVTVTKQVEFLGLTTSLGVFIFSVTYLANDILAEYWGRREALKLVAANLAAQIAFMAYSAISIWTPAASSDEASPAIATLFTVTPRITVAAVVSAVGGFVCVSLFSFLKARNRKGWLALAVRNGVSTVIGNWVNTVVFFTIAFYGVFPDQVLSQIILSAIIAKFTVGILDTPFMFMARWAKNLNPANRTLEADWSSR
jgi:uncharacterized integral membrane protein (TIGR00697 family)